MKNVSLLLLMTLLLAGSSEAQTIADKKQLKKIDELMLDKYKSIAPGCVVLVAEKGKLVYNRAYGLANIELDAAMKPGMVFRVGSITKQYTAIGILKLVEAGKLSLHDSIQKFIPGFPSKGYTITIENLLTHTSGIIGYDQLDAHIPNAIRIDFPTKQIIDSLAPLPLDFIPGSKYSYSNSNYLMLGYIIEQVTGKSYPAYLKEEVFAPAGLLNTYYDSPKKIIPGRVNGYQNNGDGFQNADYISMSLVGGAGALVSNTEDLFKWHQALYSYKLVKKELLDKAFTRFRLNEGSISDYGYGWFIKDVYGSRSIGHGGGIDGFRAIELYFPEHDVFLAVLYNSENDNFDPVLDNLISIITGKADASSYKDIKLDEKTLQSYVGTYTFVENGKNFVRIYKEGGRLFADLSNKTGTHMQLYAQSETSFYIPVIKSIRTTVEFIVENGIVKGIYIIQDKKYEAKKTE